MQIEAQNNPKQPNGMPELQKCEKAPQKATKIEKIDFLASQWDADLGLRFLDLRFKFLVVGFKILDRGLGKGCRACAKAVDNFLLKAKSRVCGFRMCHFPLGMTSGMTEGVKICGEGRGRMTRVAARTIGVLATPPASLARVRCSFWRLFFIFERYFVFALKGI